jgi:hypothetical protein
VVFDASQKGPDWQFPAFGLIFVVIGVLLVRYRNLLPMTGEWANPAWRWIFPLLWLGISLLFTVGSGVSIFVNWWSAQRALSSGTTHVVQGYVDQFHAMPYSGHDEDHFVVNGVYFAYSDYVVTEGFNTTESHGGPVHGGEYVRIYYVYQNNNGNVILKLEIREGKLQRPSSAKPSASSNSPSSALTSVSVTRDLRKAPVRG